MGLYGKYGDTGSTRTYPHLNLNSKIFSVQGMSAYQSAVLRGYEGTEEEWLDSLSWTAGSWVGTEAEYTALGTYDDNIMYFVIE